MNQTNVQGVAAREEVVERVSVMGVYVDDSKFNAAGEVHHTRPRVFAADAESADRYVDADRARWERFQQYGAIPPDDEFVTKEGEAEFAGEYRVLLVNPGKDEQFDPENWWDVPSLALNEETSSSPDELHSTRLSALDCARKWNLAHLAGDAEARSWAVAVEFSRPVDDVEYLFSLIDGMGACDISQKVAIRPLVPTNEELLKIESSAEAA